MKIIKLSYLVCAGLLFGSCVTSPSSNKSNRHHAASLQPDLNIIQGTLPNGLKYIVHENAKPENRVELRLVVNAGSVLEEDDQKGLAHFLEHMAFNGTKHFKKSELVDYLESIGVAFGADLNAYTSFDETVYKLQVPTDDEEIVEKAFLVLKDWAHGLSFDPEEIDKERGVILEEWRSGRGADRRISDQQYPVIFKDSIYAERLPIGDMNIITNAPHQRIIDFYRDWYRSDLMTIVVVGDLSGSEALEKISRYFGDIPRTEKPKKRQVFGMPSIEETLYSLVTDSEATKSEIDFYIKLPRSELKTRGDFRTRILNSLITGMFDARLHEISLQADPPYVSAWSYKGNFLRGMDIFGLGASVQDGQQAKGLDALMKELERLKRFGFVEAELERQKKDSLTQMENAWRERESTKSSSFAAKYVSSVTKGDVPVSISDQYRYYQQYLPGVSLEEINSLFKSWIIDKDRIVLAEGPEKKDAPLPDRDSLAEIISAARSLDLKPYVDDSLDEPLLASLPDAGSVTKTEKTPDLGLEKWTLSNGAQVIVKATDFKEDQILFTAYAHGGHSKTTEEDYLSASLADMIVSACGIGKFSQSQLAKKLSGVSVGVSPSISQMESGLGGTSTPGDLESLMELIHVYFTRPRSDEDAFSALKQQLSQYVENRKSSPSEQFKDVINKTMTLDHPRYQPLSKEGIEKVSLEKALSFYADQYSNAGGYTFFFVGNVKLEELKLLTEKYIGSLPARTEKEGWKDVGRQWPTGVAEQTLHKGLEPKAQVVIKYTDVMEWDYSGRFNLQAMASGLRIRLRENIREKLGGTYGVSVYAQPEHYPEPRYTFNIAFGCAPVQVEALTKAALEEVESIMKEPLDDIYLTKVKEGMLRRRETDLKENSFWISVLKFYHQNNEDPLILLEFENFVNGLNAETIQQTAKQYLGTQNRQIFKLLPEKKN